MSTVSLLSACATTSGWTSLYAQGKNAEADKKYELAEEKYRAAIKDASHHFVQEKLYEPAIGDLGRLLLTEKRDGEAVPFLLRALQLGSASNMPLEENVELLHKLARAEAVTQDWESAAGTEKTLITLLECQKSPLTPELVDERKFYDELTIKVAQYRKDHPRLAETESSTQ